MLRAFQCEQTGERASPERGDDLCEVNNRCNVCGYCPSHCIGHLGVNDYLVNFDDVSTKDGE